MYKYLNILLILNINFGIWTFAKESNDAEFINIVCTPDNKVFVNASCRLVSRRHKPRAISIDVDITQTIAYATFRLEVLRRLNGYHPFVVNYTFNACKAFKNQGLNPMTKILRNWIVNNSNLKIPCPIKPQHFHIKDFYPDLRIIPSIIPKGRFRADIFVLNNNDSTTMLAAQFHFILKDNF